MSLLHSAKNEIPLIVALIGATPIAERIAAGALRASLDVIIDDVSDARLQVTSINLHAVVGAEHRCAPSPRDRSDSPQSGFCSSRPIPNLTLTQSIESAIRAADFIIDTLPDDLEVKLELFTLFDKFAKPNAIFITTGSIPIDDLAGITFCPDRCIAVELNVARNRDTAFRLTTGAQTSQQTIAATTDLFTQILNLGASIS